MTCLTKEKDKEDRAVFFLNTDGAALGAADRACRSTMWMHAVRSMTCASTAGVHPVSVIVHLSNASAQK
ncbi:hypothetical protein GS18_0205780 [Metabacillus indicus]|uniref:Uncharacterized protein n=1 Tax=Metabacillus indicus TaxID=246786 RepID=A0A084H4B1_METID|nr:hypothetical protein GS18_0205780 [Metabacillus indicus]